ncbi:MAG: ABC transporter ATP-binding protein [Proteobacteria bacterium]|nr:ABC transporter ATP-binding protein [Pseudomonadota bacterium]
MTATILELRRVCKGFERTIAAAELSLAVGRGEFFTFLGPSGSGKSTILRMIAGLERPDSGQILIDGRDVVRVPPWRRNLGMVFQQYALFPHMTVAQNVAYGLKSRGRGRREVERRVSEMLELVGLAGMQGRNATVLSGGEQQRVALARALAAEPTMLLLDEPLSALDEKIRRGMQTELKRIQRRTGTTFLYVTHDQEEALTMSDRIVVLNHGQAVQCDAPEAIYQRPRTRFTAEFFRGCNVLDGVVASAGAGRLRVRFGGVEATVDDGRAAAPGAKIGLAIRGENLHLGMAAASCPIRLAARLDEVVYRGTNIDYRLGLADGQSVVATSTRREPGENGGAVTVGFADAAVVLLDD